MKGSQLKSEAYLEPKRASMIKLLCENSSRLKAVNHREQTIVIATTRSFSCLKFMTK